MASYWVTGSASGLGSDTSTWYTTYNKLPVEDKEYVKDTLIKHVNARIEDYIKKNLVRLIHEHIRAEVRNETPTYSIDDLLNFPRP